MDLQLKGKRALVTGSNSGIGEAAVRCLAAEGATVVVHGRNQARADAVAADIRAGGGEAVVVTADLASQEGCEALAAGVRAALGGLDILINNAGGSEDPSRTWKTSDWAVWQEEYETNVGSAVRMTEQFLPGMIEQRWGRVVNVTSTQATMPYAMTAPAYNAAKAAIINLTLSLSRTYGKHGITFNAISPGPVDSADFRHFALNLPPFKGMSFDEVEPILAKKWGVSRGRLGRPDDLAGAFALLASPLGSYITGVTFRVDGGMSGYMNI